MNLRVGITGNIGAGKSTFSKLISELGYQVLFADDISKEILANDPEVRAKVIENFGAQSFKEQKINTDYIASVVFSDQKKLRTMNSILHPKVRIKIDELYEDLFTSHNIVFVEAALIFESKIEKMFDYIVLIIADNNIRKNRSIKAKNITEEDFLNRVSNQINQELKEKRADFTFSNNGTLDELKNKAELLIKILESKIK